jgi:hypothetical protein
MDGGDGYRVVKDYGIEAFFDLSYIFLWDLHEGLSKEYVTGIELGVEA